MENYIINVISSTIIACKVLLLENFLPFGIGVANSNKEEEKTFSFDNNDIKKLFLRLDIRGGT